MAGSGTKMSRGSLRDWNATRSYVLGSRTVQASACDDNEFVLDTLGYVKPVELSMYQLPQTAIDLPCTTDYTSCRVQHSLQLVGDDLGAPAKTTLQYGSQRVSAVCAVVDADGGIR